MEQYKQMIKGQLGFLAFDVQVGIAGIMKRCSVLGMIRLYVRRKTP
jgi:hypothetical protein